MLVVYLYQITTIKTNIMTTLTITVNGNKAGEQIFFILNILKSNFLNVIEMNWENVEDVLKGEKEGHYTISK
jgi:hypothetical protein